MRKFLLIIDLLLIAIIECIDYPINNNCVWPEDCYINVKLTQSCLIESVSIDNASEKVRNVNEQQIREMSSRSHTYECYAVTDKSTVRCYSRCYSINQSPDVPENHITEYSHSNLERILIFFHGAQSLENRMDKVGWLSKEKDKTAEHKYWQDCVIPAVQNSTGIPSGKEVKAPVKVDLKCEHGQSENCLVTIKYTSNGLEAIESTDGPADIGMTDFFNVNSHSCRIFEKSIEFLCRRANAKYQSLDYLIETIYLLGRDRKIRGPYVENNNRTEHDQNIPMVLEMLQQFRISYPKDMYGWSNLDCSDHTTCYGYCSLRFEIDTECRSVTQQFPDFQRLHISAKRFIDLEHLGSIALELEFHQSKLQLRVYCKMHCIVDNTLYARIMNGLNRQIFEKPGDDLIFFGSSIKNEDKNEYVACAYYSFRHEILRNMYNKYDEENVENNLKFRESWRSKSNISFIISTVIIVIFALMMTFMIVIGTISHFRNQVANKPITFDARKSTIIARRKKPTDMLNSKDKTGDFYECVTKTSAVNNTDLASVLEDAKSRD